MARVTAWREEPARPARHADWPAQVGPELRAALRAAGIDRPYTHQAEAIASAMAGRHVVVVTPTASGKTLCFNVPILQAVLDDPNARALCLYPTKALAQDQNTGLNGLIDRLGRDIKTYTYDGDTPPNARRAIRAAGHVVITNPDMLHTGILPHHTRWVKLFENLRYVVIDELHAYRGVFGSHLANVLRRLKRVCRHYGSSPVFILCSATIANPEELAERMVGEPVHCVARTGAPAAARHFVIYSPPVVNERLGLRRSVLFEARDIAARLLRNDIQTIVFARSRLAVEVLLGYLRAAAGRTLGAERIQAYRGGYLPEERRQIERGLRDGTIRGVVSTNALELGIDIGSLDACVMAGYPGTVASTWQQAGRAGRRSGTSLAVLVASSHPLDQYIAANPDFFFGTPPEAARIHPDNLFILMSHLKCAAFELPFTAGERFGVHPVDELLDYLAEERVVRPVGDRWFWMADNFPANDVSLRSAAEENVVIIDQAGGRAEVIGEIDKFSAPLFVHEQAIYLHRGGQYQVERFDFEENKAYVRRVDVDYYTDANLAVDIKVLDMLRGEDEAPGVPDRAARRFGEVLVTARPTIFKKIKFDTRENVGWGRIHLPEQQMHTTAYWVIFPSWLHQRMAAPELQAALTGIGHVLAQLAPLYVICDPRDLYAVPQVRSPFTQAPTVYLYDAVPGGVGLADRLFEMHDELLRAAHQLLAGCSCRHGCPACVGADAVLDTGIDTRAAARALLERVTQREPA
ncbi:MAG TPA: DEAD/DEAH box helicase [Bacillota bacterium]